MADSDNITAHAEILADFAEVLRAHGDLVGAADALAAAVGLHEEKGNVLPARRCRELLAAITAGRPGSDDEVTVSRGGIPASAPAEQIAPAAMAGGGHRKSRVDAQPPPVGAWAAEPAAGNIVAAMDEVTVERLVAEQRYYRERAPEYDDWWFRRAGYALDAETEARWFADVRQLEAALEAFGLRRRP